MMMLNNTLPVFGMIQDSSLGLFQKNLSLASLSTPLSMSSTPSSFQSIFSDVLGSSPSPGPSSQMNSSASSTSLPSTQDNEGSPSFSNQPPPGPSPSSSGSHRSPLQSPSASSPSNFSKTNNTSPSSNDSGKASSHASTDLTSALPTSLQNDPAIFPSDQENSNLSKLHKTDPLDSKQMTALLSLLQSLTGLPRETLFTALQNKASAGDSSSSNDLLQALSSFLSRLNGFPMPASTLNGHSFQSANSEPLSENANSQDLLKLLSQELSHQTSSSDLSSKDNLLSLFQELGLHPSSLKSSLPLNPLGELQTQMEQFLNLSPNANDNSKNTLFSTFLTHLLLGNNPMSLPTASVNGSGGTSSSNNSLSLLLNLFSQGSSSSSKDFSNSNDSNHYQHTFQAPLSEGASPTASGPATMVTPSNSASSSTTSPLGTGTPVQDVARFIVQKTQTLQEGDRLSARLQLHPPDLGEVQVDVQLHSQTLNVKILVDRPETHRLLMDNLGQLKSALEAHGLNPQHVDLQTNYPSPGSSHSGGSSQGGSASHQQYAPDSPDYSPSLPALRSSNTESNPSSITGSLAHLIDKYRVNYVI